MTILIKRDRDSERTTYDRPEHAYNELLEIYHTGLSSVTYHRFSDMIKDLFFNESMKLTNGGHIKLI